MKNKKDRYNKFKEDFQKSDLSPLGFNKIDAVNGRKLDIENIISKKAYETILQSEKQGYRKHHYELTRGAIGCYLSHIKCFKNVSQQTEPYAFIFEDDVRILKYNLLEDINKTISDSIPDDWDILLLGCVCFVCGKFYSYYDVNRYFLMHGYLIKKESAIKILHMLNQKPIEQQIDAKLSDLAERGLIKIYCLRDKLAVQRNMGTDIQVPVKNIKGVNPFDPLYENDLEDTKE